MNLIANTGIQLFSLPVTFDSNNQFRMYFHEWLDVAEQQKKIEIAHYFPDAEIWVKKFALANLGYAIGGDVTESWEDIRLDEEFDERSIIRIDTEDAVDSGCFDLTVGQIRKEEWEKIENVWLPIPFFLLKGRKSAFGPTNWCRGKLIPRSISGKERQYSLLLAFDTKAVFEKEDYENEDLNETPVFTNSTERSKTYSICNNEFKLVSYCSEEFNCEWVDRFLLKLFHGVDSIQELRGVRMPKLRYLALYMFLVRYLSKFANIPQVLLFSDANVGQGNVDLVVDIGNSRTCAVLFDGSDFTKCSPLELQDFTVPVNESGELNKHRDSFDMRLAFRAADFGGNLGLANSRQFIYPSFIRLGKEASYLIHKAANMNIGAEKNSTFSSPKRYLWDSRPQKNEWEFVYVPGEEDKNHSIYVPGISEQLETDGSLNLEGNGGIMMHYSRKTLMTFAFLEILSQAKLQINSYEQRSYWGDESMPRRIGRIIITAPTAMSHVEQLALRKCAEDAAIMLNRFYSDTFSEECDDAELRKQVQVIPSAKTIANRSDWIYDEATSAQFVFLYAEIKERYQKHVREYFNFYGKVRSDLEGYNEKSLTIGSVDIGAGTTDVMIAAYKFKDASQQCQLTPVPLFWDSFYKAGDDLLKELVHQLVIEGKHSPIERKLRQMGKNPVEVLQPFLGTNNGVSYRNRQLRSDFNIQVSVPIVSYYLELMRQNKEERRELSFDDIFANNVPTKPVLDHFEESFGFKLQDLTWTYDKNVVGALIKKTFDSLIGKISSLFACYKCDIVLLSGRPTSLEPLTSLFLDYFAISPNRLKAMNDYRVGRWYPEDKRYPFIDGNGGFINPKSIVTTGAMIGQIASNGGLNGFTLDLSELNAILQPTTDYFGYLDNNLVFTKSFLTPENNVAEIEVSSLPFRIGTRQKDIASYPSRPFYMIDFNDYKIEDRVRGRYDDDIDDNTIAMGIKNEKQKILRGFPLKVRLARDFAADKEQISVDSIEDIQGNAVNRNFINMQVQSMSEVDNFWLDSGIFDLNVNNA